MASKKSKIRRIYDLLEDHFGDLKWWPAKTPFEVIIGAVLTQNTSWSNVEKAIGELNKKKLLTPKKIMALNSKRLAGLIRSSGYHRVKAERLKEVSRFVLDECGGRLKKLGKEDTSSLREKLLRVKGIGPETADSILVYALGKPVFVVDAYTKRIFSRHNIVIENASYDEVQTLVENAMDPDTGTMNQFHALLVETAKRFCRKRAPLCGECPLGCTL
ncbi:endonuclease III domain-containing protein [Candidatus Omnitrophota bacterium]